MGPICASFISELKHRSLNTIEVSFNITRPIKSMHKNIITMTIFNMTDNLTHLGQITLPISDRLSYLWAQSALTDAGIYAAIS